jgi:DNA-binding NtrC family response regulator
MRDPRSGSDQAEASKWTEAPERQRLALEVLLVEDDDDHAELVRLSVDRSSAFRVKRRVASLAGAREALAGETFDAVVLDMMLPDGQGLDNVEAVTAVAPEMPIVVLTALRERDLGLRAIRTGAQDFVEKDELSPDRLERALRHAYGRAELAALRRARDEQAVELARRLDGVRGALATGLAEAGSLDEARAAMAGALGALSGALELISQRPD